MDSPNLPQTIDETETSMTLAAYINIVHRRRFIIGYTFVLVTVLGVVATLLTAPVYHATAFLLVTQPSLKISQVDSSNPLGDLFSSTQAYKIATQVRLLKSKQILSEAARKLGSKLPDIDVKAIEDTDIIQVDVEGNDPKKAALAANYLLDAYIDVTKTVNNEQLTTAFDFTSDGAEKAQQKLDDTETQLRKFQEDHKVSDLDKNREAQINEVQGLTDRYKTLQSTLVAANSQLAILNSEIAKEPQTQASVVSADADPIVRNTEAQIASLEAQRAGLAKRYTSINKQVVALDAQIAESRKYLVLLRNQTPIRNLQKNPAYDALISRRQLLEEQASGTAAEAAETAKQLLASRQQLAQFPYWKQKMASLQRQLEIAQANYTLLSAKREDLRLRLKVPRVDARPMEYASVPNGPIRPKKTLNIIFSAFLGLVLGVMLALIQEFLDDRINSQEEAERVFRLPTLGLIPLVQEEGIRLLKDTKSFSPLMESYRSLRTNISFAAVDNPVRTMIITSTSPAEGKSHIVVNLAMAMAMEGRKVIVVDADLRRPTQHKLFQQAQTPGLTDILIGKQRLQDVIRTTMADGVQLIPAGSSAPNPAELLSSEAMARLIDSLRNIADIVIIDTPPALAVSDSILLSSRVDGVLFVASHGETKKGNARQALQMLTRARANILGIVLNKIDTTNRGYYYNYYHYNYAPYAAGAELPDEGKALVGGDSTSTDGDVYKNSDEAANK